MQFQHTNFRWQNVHADLSQQLNNVLGSPVAVIVALAVFILALGAILISTFVVRRGQAKYSQSAAPRWGQPQHETMPAQARAKDTSKRPTQQFYANTDSDRGEGPMAMDPLTFVLTVAAGVLSSVISRLVENPVDTVPSQEVKQLVSVHVRQGPNSQVLINDSNLGTFTNSALNEVYEIAGRDEVLEVEHGNVRLQPGVSLSRDMIAFQIAHLREIVEMRRVELLSDNAQIPDSTIDDTESADDDHSSDTGADSYEWVEPEQRAIESPWDNAIREMHQRIRDRRLGGNR